MPIHPTAVIDPLAFIDPTATIGPHVVIDGPVRIGPQCRIAASAVLLGQTEIGAGCKIHSHAVVGDVPQDRAYQGGESFCRVGSGCTIREGVTIHRGTAPGSATIIGNQCFLMTNSHVAHNCELGDGVTLISGALLAGFVKVGPKAVISGNVGVHQFVRIGELAMISALAKVVQDVPPFCMVGREGAVIGLNRIGLIRAGLSPAERAEIKAAYRLIYRSGVCRDTALESLIQIIVTDAGRRLLEFMAVSSTRGVTKESLRPNVAA